MMSAMAYFPAPSAEFKSAVEALKGQRVAVLGHVRPDGDCIGSQVALCRVLRSQGIDAICVNQHPVPPFCEAFVQDTPFFLPAQADLAGRVAVTVDCADRRRLGEALQMAFVDVFLNVDHHISNTEYAEHNLIIGNSAATAEVLAGFFLDNGYPIDAVTAQALYVGIATDTGQFRFSSTTRQTFALTCALMDCGADPAAAAQELYEKESPAKLALLQRFLASFRYYCEGRVCLGLITDADWSATGARKEDTEGLVDYARSIDGVEIGVLIEEREGKVKGSFRAKHGYHRVDELAKQFNGGGHASAAGFNPDQPLEQLLPRLLAALEGHFAKLDSVAAPANV